jgi:type I restriction enzyme M protein
MCFTIPANGHLQRLHDTATNNQQILQANFEDYLNGFSGNVKEIIEKFKLKSQVRHMASKDVLLNVLEKFTSPYINLTPFEKNDPDGRNCRHFPTWEWAMCLKN